MKKCISCGNEIHPKRLEILPSTTTCVGCSTTNKKAGITVTIGEGDHTYNDVVIMDHEDFIKYQELEKKIHGKRKDDISHPDEEEILDEEIEENELDGIEEVKNIDFEDLEEDLD